MPVTHEEQTQDWVRCDSAPPRTMSIFLCSPCPSREGVCAADAGRLVPGLLGGISRASDAGAEDAGRRCEVGGDPSRCCCSPEDVLHVPRLAKQEEGKNGASEVGTDSWAARSSLHVQAGICICKYPAAHPVARYAGAKAGVRVFNGSCALKSWLLPTPSSEVRHQGEDLKI